MENTLRQIETENIVIYKEFCYGPKVVEMTKEFVTDLIQKGIIVKGTFNDDAWKCYSGVKCYTITFDFDRSAYEKHIGKEFGISYETMKQMIKCYVAYCTGEYIFNTLARVITKSIKDFLCCYKERELKLSSEEVYYVEDFLSFINTPEAMIDDVLSNVKKIAADRNPVRKLSPLIHYLIIENEINKMYREPISDEDFIKYFPIYFWVNITFILPLRATEMLVTPFDCVEIDDDEITLKVRRTILKGRKHRVYYDVERDYEVFTYHLRGIIKKQVFETIQRYKEMTKNHERRFLFDYGAAFSNEMLSLSGFNNLIKVFMDERIIDNPQYEYAKNVSGLSGFEYVNAGDSRPIAMANLFFQDAGADICRQLANHMNITTSEGYFTNVSETLYCSCPICSHQKTISGINDFKTLYPDIAKEISPEGNEGIDLDVISSMSKTKLVWICPKGHYYKTAVDKRTSRGAGCPYCSGKKPIAGENDLGTIHPEVQKYWNAEKNGSIENYARKSRKKVNWKCENGHEWVNSIINQVNSNKCPYCEGRYLIIGKNDVATIYPQLVQEWDSEANGLEPSEVKANMHTYAFWKCQKGHSWRTNIGNRVKGKGCPYCSGNYPIKGENDLATLFPWLVKEWDYKLNRKGPDEYLSRSNIRVWWKCENNHSWKALISERTRGTGCPQCRRNST